MHASLRARREAADGRRAGLCKRVPERRPQLLGHPLGARLRRGHGRACPRRRERRREPRGVRPDRFLPRNRRGGRRRKRAAPMWASSGGSNERGVACMCACARARVRAPWQLAERVGPVVHERHGSATPHPASSAITASPQPPSSQTRLSSSSRSVSRHLRPPSLRNAYELLLEAAAPRRRARAGPARARTPRARTRASCLRHAGWHRPLTRTIAP